MFRRVLPVASLVFCLGLLPDRPFAAEPITQRELPPIPLSVDEIRERIARISPSLKVFESIHQPTRLLNSEAQEGTFEAARGALTGIE